ncbi:hypothetical protein MMC34_003918 [Xylographa carneopallida]|nr:hypothetical protein [Xylographa carneopallida]
MRFQRIPQNYSSPIPKPRGISVLATSPDAIPSSRWLSDLKSRVGKCIMFGLRGKQIEEAGRIAKVLGEEWRGLIAGREGFLLNKGQEGTVRWGEMDLLLNCIASVFFLAPVAEGHLNNVAYVRFAESSRVHFFSGIPPSGSSAEHTRQWRDTCTPKGLGLILKSITVDYKYPLTFPNHFTIYHRLKESVSASASPTKLLLSSLLLSTTAQRPAARIQEEIVIFDYRIQKSARLPEHMQDMLRVRWEEQEQAKRMWESRAKQVEEMVEELEKESWKRLGAVEDMGSGN